MTSTDQESVRIRYMSDLHLWPGFAKTIQPPLTEDGEILVVAGDLANNPGLAREWLKQIPTPVIYVFGNHEFYGHDFNEAFAEYRKALTGLDHVHLLERDTVTVGGVRFLGATMWTNFDENPVLAQEAEQGMNDYQYITAQGELLKAQAVAERHNVTVEWLRQTLADGDSKRTVVVTHHAPSRLSGHRRLCPAYCAQLDNLVLDRGPAVWIHGHLHKTAEYALGDTLVVSNPFGYGWPGANEVNPAFDIGAAVMMPNAKTIFGQEARS